jgi:hypothetical protein
MDEGLDRIVERCLATAQQPDAAAGRRDVDAEADAAFARLFTLLEPKRPLPGFARRVVQRVHREQLLAGRHGSDVRSAGSPGAVAAVLAAILGVEALLIGLQPALVVQTFAAAVTTAVGAAFWASQLLAPAIGLSEVAMSVGRALLTALATPEGSLALSVILIGGALVVATLQRMLSSEEESSVW